jgi:hypothetical protein
VEPKFHAVLKNISCDLKEKPFNSSRQGAINFNGGTKEVISKCLRMNKLNKIIFCFNIYYAIGIIRTGRIQDNF